MLVLISMPDGPTGERFESILHARGHDVVRLDRLTKTDVLESGAEVFICGDRRSMRLVSAVAHSAHIVAALPDLEDRRVTQALASGAVDVIAIQARAEELLARVTLPTRIAKRERPPEDIAQTAWDDIQGTVNAQLAEMLGRAVAEVDGESETPRVCAQIRLTCSQDQSTMDLVVGCSKASARALLGIIAPGLPPSKAALRDSLREIANHLAGGLKRAATAQNLEVTLGLPEDCDPELHARATTTWSVALGDTTVALGLTPGRATRRSVPVCELVPGMVLQHDVLNDAGMPFVRTGTALTERTIERLAEVLGPSRTVAVTIGVTDGAGEEDLGSDGIVFFDVA